MVVSEAFRDFFIYGDFFYFDLAGDTLRFVVFCLGKNKENEVLGMEMVTILGGLLY